MSDTTLSLRKSPLDPVHRAANARMVPYAGWEMPVEYSGIANEHLAVRTRAGLFDVSHMGEIEIAGRNALAAVQTLLSNDASRLSVGQAQYSALLTPGGTFLDDVIVYRMAGSHFMLVVNAAAHAALRRVFLVTGVRRDGSELTITMAVHGDPALLSTVEGLAA